nr:hypothetical protein [Tanacetum cinerariifolium]
MALQPHSSGVKIQDPMLDHQDKYMMKAQVHVLKSFAISDEQPLPRRKYHCQHDKSIKWTGCAAGCFPFTYLGLPIGANMNLTSSGCLTLIKPVLGSLGIYYLSIFKAPETILNSIESLRSRFFWGGSQDSRNMAWVKWSQVLPYFEKGGLQIGSLKAFNLALLQKWHWRLLSSPNNMWVNIIKALHGQEGGLNNQGCSFNGTWSRIIGTSNFRHSKGIIPLNSFCFKVGCGTRWQWNWSRYDIGTRNTAYLSDLLLKISQIDISVDEDTCTWVIYMTGWREHDSQQKAKRRGSATVSFKSSNVTSICDVFGTGDIHDWVEGTRLSAEGQTAGICYCVFQALELIEHFWAMGETNALVNRVKFLKRDTALAATAVYESMFAAEDGTIPATFHVIL